MSKRNKRARKGPIKEKILLLLLGGVALGLSGSPKRYFSILHDMRKGWQDIDNEALHRAIKALYTSKLVDTKNRSDGTVELVLSKEGRSVALAYDLENMQIKKPHQWDGKWRMVMFDVPENLKQLRETLRLQFRQMGFYEFQKSVFVHPHPCWGEIEYIMEFYNARRHIRFITATQIDNELELKRHFGIKI